MGEAPLLKWGKSTGQKEWKSCSPRAATQTPQPRTEGTTRQLHEDSPSRERYIKSKITSKHPSLAEQQISLQPIILLHFPLTKAQTSANFKRNQFHYFIIIRRAEPPCTLLSPEHLSLLLQAHEVLLSRLFTVPFTVP